MKVFSEYNFNRKRWYLADDVDKGIQELKEETLRHLHAADKDIAKHVESELNLLKEIREVRIENARLKACEVELHTLKDQLRALLKSNDATSNNTGTPVTKEKGETND